MSEYRAKVLQAAQAYLAAIEADDEEGNGGEIDEAEMRLQDLLDDFHGIAVLLAGLYADGVKRGQALGGSDER